MHVLAMNTLARISSLYTSTQTFEQMHTPIRVRGARGGGGLVVMSRQILMMSRPAETAGRAALKNTHTQMLRTALRLSRGLGQGRYFSSNLGAETFLSGTSSVYIEEMYAAYKKSPGRYAKIDTRLPAYASHFLAPHTSPNTCF